MNLQERLYEREKSRRHSIRNYISNFPSDRHVVVRSTLAWKLAPLYQIGFDDPERVQSNFSPLRILGAFTNYWIVGIHSIRGVESLQYG